MKFGKELETNAESMPEGWRPYVIHYKALKKQINAIVKELDEQGLPSSIIKNLLSETMAGNMHRVEYSFDEEKEHLKTCIKVIIDEADTIEASAFGPEPLSQSQEAQLSKLLVHELLFLNKSASSSSSDLPDEERRGLERREDLEEATTASESSEGTEDPFQSLGDMDDPHLPPMFVDARASSAAGDPTRHGQDRQSAVHGPDPGTQKRTPHATFVSPSPMQLHHPSPRSPSPASSCSVSPPSTLSPEPDLASDLDPQAPLDTLVTPGAIHEIRTAALQSDSTSLNESQTGSSRIHTAEEDGKKFIVIELTADTAFFDQLGEEIHQLSKLQQSYKHEFESKVEDLSKILTVVSSPQNKDMYTWREILKMYLDAQVFVGDQESDRSTRSSEKARKQLNWFLTELDRSKLVHKFKQNKSRQAFGAFSQLNRDLIIMKQFKELNQMAMFKILKKHDKRTNLTASSGFPKHLHNEAFYNDNISKALTFTIGTQLLSIIPQPDDYACPICMAVAWKPIRLNCSHVFCVRCLIKAQRRKMVHCPICRQTNSVQDADASNLDVAMMNFMKLYFPKEIKEKRKDSSREQAQEEMQALTGRRWTEMPDSACIIM
ncbi:SPX domain-containing protein [Mortierella sp. GBAus27b]|nr:hypothetical protein BGX31_010661 [Mortierella sp. GBA43]KAI8352211.1 SPX domain-containing protein [Mortierella sp. GBAus27b]